MKKLRVLDRPIDSLKSHCFDKFFKSHILYTRDFMTNKIYNLVILFWKIGQCESNRKNNL